jgi:rod shape determining protein RodA
LAFFQAQPSEFAKLSFIFAMAHYLSRPADELRMSGVFGRALALTVLPFVLIMKEPDLGSALILLPVGLTMLFVAGFRLDS